MNEIAGNRVHADIMRAGALTEMRSALLDPLRQQRAQRAAETIVREDKGAALLAAAFIVAEVALQARSRMQIEPHRRDLVDALGGVVGDGAASMVAISDGVPQEHVIAELIGAGETP